MCWILQSTISVKNYVTEKIIVIKILLQMGWHYFIIKHAIKILPLNMRYTHIQCKIRSLHKEPQKK